MTKIIRTKSKAHGGITPDEKRRMDEPAQLWIARAMRTEPIEPDKIIPAIEGLYEVAGLKKPRVVIVPSPLVMAFAYGASAAIWYRRKNATYATAAICDASAEKLAAEAYLKLVGHLGVECAKRWWNVYHGGNMWAGYDGYLTACRDILGLELREHAGYAHWEQAAIHGGFRVMHEEFCLVSDFPEVSLRMRKTAHIAKWDHRIAGAMAEGALLGFLALRRVDHCLDQLFIAPNAKRLGIGRSLFNVAKTAMPNGFWLRTAADNKEACAFYEAVGMAANRIEPHPRHGHDTVIYVIGKPGLEEPRSQPQA